MRLILIIILFFCGTCALAQEKAAYDSSVIKVTAFDKPALDAYRKDQQFQYEQERPPTVSLWKRFWNWFWSKVDQVMATESGKNTVYTILIILAIVALAWFIWRMSDSRSKLFGDSGKRSLDYEVGSEDIHSIPFEEAIRQAIAEENYRLAVRLTYLHSIKLLSDQEMIDWKPGKTNHAYEEELRGHIAQGSFSQLTAQFEQAWYGGEVVGKENYHGFEEQFRQFKQQVGK